MRHTVVTVMKHKVTQSDMPVLRTAPAARGAEEGAPTKTYSYDIFIQMTGPCGVACCWETWAETHTHALDTKTMRRVFCLSYLAPIPFGEGFGSCVSDFSGVVFAT